MKRLLSLILTIFIMASFTGCDSLQQPSGPFAPERTVIARKSVKQIDDLANTYYKLTQDNRLKIAYLGGSVTDGQGGQNGYCWRSATTKWFRTNFPKATITEVNESVGATGSYWGYFRVNEDIISHSPDLIFIEFAINDLYVNLTKEQSMANMEGIVCKIREFLPKADIVFVFVTDEERVGQEFTAVAAHKSIAQHYGIPYINAGEALAKDMQSTGYRWKNYSNDNVHPNNYGYKVYAESVAEFLKESFVTAPPKVKELKDHKMPSSDYISNVSKSSKVVMAKDITDIQGCELLSLSNQAFYFTDESLHCAKGNVINFNFKGIGLGMMADAREDSEVLITVDDQEPQVVRLNGDCTEHILLDNLTNTEHSVKIEIYEGKRIVVGALLIAQ